MAVAAAVGPLKFCSVCKVRLERRRSSGGILEGMSAFLERSHCSRTCSSNNRPRIPEAERFWRNVRKAGPDDCWEWMGATKAKSGYGHFKSDGYFESAHRVSYRYAHGGIEPGLVVRHSCDNPKCCNPAHLLVGTHADNADDMINRGRAMTGLKNPMGILSDEDVRAIMSSASTAEAVAARYGISEAYALRLLSGKAQRCLRVTGQIQGSYRRPRLKIANQ